MRSRNRGTPRRPPRSRRHSVVAGRPVRKRRRSGSLLRRTGPVGGARLHREVWASGDARKPDPPLDPHHRRQCRGVQFGARPRGDGDRLRRRARRPYSAHLNRGDSATPGEGEARHAQAPGLRAHEVDASGRPDRRLVGPSAPRPTPSMVVWRELDVRELLHLFEAVAPWQQRPRRMPMQAGQVVPVHRVCHHGLRTACHVDHHALFMAV